MQLFLGVDGGQSSTTALIGDDTGKVLAIGRGGPCNHVKSGDGREKFINAIQSCVSAAAREAGLSNTCPRYKSACLGFSGGPADKQKLVEEMIDAEHLLVTHDALIALSGATAGQPGVIVIAGTGSIAFGRGADGGVARAGGWGYIYGDEGGGFDIARHALRASLQMEEGWGAETTLHSKLLEATGAVSANDLLHRFYTVDYPRHRVATYARLVDEAARAGDAIANDILTRAAQQLAALAAAVRHQAFGADDIVRIAPIGGVFRSEIVEQRFRTLIDLGSPAVYGPPEYGPAAGALLEAYGLAGSAVRLTGVPLEKEA
jgi:N-acetylglucosamine kinase-like BadF-type ATPase